MPARKTGPARSHLALADRLLQSVRDAKGTTGALPSISDVAVLVEDFLTLFFPESGRARALLGAGRKQVREHMAGVLASLERRLEEAVYLGLHRRCAKQRSADRCRSRARAITRRMLRTLPQIRSQLATDVEAAFEADPAASGTDEIIACYPGLYAIAVYRAAHQLLREGAEIVPRMMTEDAHSRTGIDIHPGASIGPSFFIDHGTGLVIGETTVIGRRVRIYQGVTLGALSVRRRQRGGSEGTGGPRKRHPTIEDEVIIYANATILGGDTVIGRGAVVGGNAWITYSVPPGIRVGVGT